MTEIHLAISTCPNDTFAFNALINELVDLRGLTFRTELLDISQLNSRLFAGDFDVAKTSFHAACLLDDVCVLPSGSALGFGVGPLLLASREGVKPTESSQLTLCPGPQTTATMLFHMFYPQTTQIDHAVFSEIMPALQKGSADFGVCIHEGRFTWQEAGLACVEDLGTRWEKETGHPLPLGGIVARKKLPADTISNVQAVLHDSLRHALNDPTTALPLMRQHAQEFDDAVLMKHVDLYVNDWTVDLGDVGRAALNELASRASIAGLATGAASLDVWDG